MALDAYLTATTVMGVPGPLAIPGYVLVPTGSQVFYVRSGGAGSGAPAGLDTIYSTVAGVLSLCRANRGDTIIVLPGHTETLTGTDVWSGMVAGTKIIGLGSGTERPTFTFATGATTQLVLNDANVTLDNLIFQNGAGDVTLAIDVTAASVTIQNCTFFVSDASNKLTTAFRLSSGANDFHLFNTQIIGGATAITDTFLINAAVTRLVVDGCYMAASLATTEGLITNATAAATRVLIKNSVFENNVANSTVALKFMAAVTGTLWRCALGVMVADGAGVGIAALNTPANLRINEVYTATATKASVLSAAATTA